MAPDTFTSAPKRPGGPTPAAAQPTLRLGAGGPAVKALQLQLNELGESVLASGQFGPRTMEAVRRFQVAKGIVPATGMVDAATQKALQELAAKGNPRTIPRQPRKADWFQAGAQVEVGAREANPEDVPLSLADGREVTLEQAIEIMNAAYQRLRGGGPPDPDDDRDILVTQVNREYDKFNRKSYLTTDERAQLGNTLKEVFDLLGEVQVLKVGTGKKKPAIVVEYG